MPNPTRLSEFAKIYFIIGDQNISLNDPGGAPDVTDATILGYAWNEICATSVSPSSNVNNYEVKDRCVGKTVGNVPGREGFTFDMTLNMFRQNPTFPLKAWHAACDNGDIISFLMMNDDKDDVNAWGIVTNAVRIDESEDQPEEGLIVVNYTFGPAARSQYYPLKRRVYGSSIP